MHYHSQRKMIEWTTRACLTRAISFSAGFSSSETDQAKPDEEATLGIRVYLQVSSGHDLCTLILLRIYSCIKAKVLGETGQ